MREEERQRSAKREKVAKQVAKAEERKRQRESEFIEIRLLLELKVSRCSLRRLLVILDATYSSTSTEHW